MGLEGRIREDAWGSGYSVVHTTGKDVIVQVELGDFEDLSIEDLPRETPITYEELREMHMQVQAARNAGMQLRREIQGLASVWNAKVVMQSDHVFTVELPAQWIPELTHALDQGLDRITDIMLQAD